MCEMKSTFGSSSSRISSVQNETGYVAWSRLGVPLALSLSRGGLVVVLSSGFVRRVVFRVRTAWDFLQVLDLKQNT